MKSKENGGLPAKNAPVVLPLSNSGMVATTPNATSDPLWDKQVREFKNAVCCLADSLVIQRVYELSQQYLGEGHLAMMTTPRYLELLDTVADGYALELVGMTPEKAKHNIDALVGQAHIFLFEAVCTYDHACEKDNFVKND